MITTTCGDAYLGSLFIQHGDQDTHYNHRHRLLRRSRSLSVSNIVEMSKETPKPITVDELEAIAKKKLPQNVYDYYSCGADDQKCLRRNRDAFDRYDTRS